MPRRAPLRPIACAAGLQQCRQRPWHQSRHTSGSLFAIACASPCLRGAPAPSMRRAKWATNGLRSPSTSRGARASSVRSGGATRCGTPAWAWPAQCPWTTKHWRGMPPTAARRQLCHVSAIAFSRWGCLCASADDSGHDSAASGLLSPQAASPVRPHSPTHTHTCPPPCPSPGQSQHPARQVDG
jgi:hypothetical protein